MTAVVATMSNNMAHEYDKEISHIASTNNEIAQDNGAESKLKAKEDVEMIAEPTLESMGLQREAEDDAIVENLSASKISSKRKSSEKGETKYCEKLLGEINEPQQEAINRISRPGGLLQMKKWLETARSEEQPKRLGMLLAQCWKAEINVDELSKTNIGKLVRELRKHPDSDVRTASNEVLKKWKQAVEDDEMKKVNASKKLAAAPIPATAASKPAPVSKPSSSSSTSKPQSSAPVTSKVEKKNTVVSRPKTARTKNTAFRKTGFEEDEEESRAPAPKKPAPTIASQLSTPMTKPTVAFPKKSPVVSNNFMNALSAGSSVNAMELQRKRKKSPPVIDLPLSSPLDPVVVTPTTTTASVASTVPPPDPLGPDPTRVPAPGARRRIHFADDKGEALVHTKFIENVLNNKAHRPNSDMKHADAEAERISLKQMKTDVDEDDDDDETRMEMPEMGNAEVDNSWRLISYYKNAQSQFSQDLIDEEEARHGNVMRTFVAQPYVPIEHPSEPDDGEYAVTRFRELETIPTDFVMEETVEQEPMEVDTLSANVSTVSPVPVPNFAIPPVSTSSIPVNNFQILSNIDVHGAGQAHPPRPVPYPMNSMYSVPPPQILRHEPQPVPPPSTEFIILEDEPSKLNASNLSNNSAIDANSFLQKLKGKGKSLDDILGKVKGSKIPVSSAPLPSSASAAASIPTNFSVPPPNFSGNMPPVLPVPPPSGEFQILNNIDIHASQAFSAPPRPSGPRMPNMPGGRQQTRPPPGSSGKICPFYLKGTCTFGNNCFNEHRQLQQKPMGGGYRAAAPQYNQNNRGGGSLRGRFNATTNKAPFNSSSQNSNTEASQGQDNFYRSRKRSDDFRGNRRRDRSPSPRRGRRRSRSNSPERYHRRHRSRSPHSHSSSPEDEYRRRRRSSPQSSRSPSRSPLPSRSPSKSPN